MNIILLHGALADTFGTEFNVSIRDPLEAYRALECQLPGFRQAIRAGNFYLLRETDNGVFAMTEDTLLLGLGNARLHIIPEVAGAASNAKGIGKTVLGVALLAASFFLPGSTIFAGSALTWSGVAGTTGLGLALGGAALLIAPHPKLNSGTDYAQSNVFQGGLNSSGQNLPVPLAYGRIRVPSIAVATAIETNQVNVDSGQVYDTGFPEFGGTQTINYGSPFLLIQGPTPVAPTNDTAGQVFWLDSTSNFLPHKVNGGRTGWDVQDNTYASGVYTITDGAFQGLKIFVTPTAVLSGMQVGDLQVGALIEPQVYTGTQWVPDA